MYDQLTGLANRVWGTKCLEDMMNQIRRERTWGAIFFLDLDGFKEVNDTHGHNVGDLLLKEIGQRLTHSIRQSDTVFRLGGDEFVILLPFDSKPADLHHIAEKLAERISESYQLDGHTVHIGASIGIRVVTPHDGTSADTVMREADSAMYAAKRSGQKNQYRIFDESPRD